MAHRVFISYRRDDSQFPALAIREALRWALADDEVFFDRLDLHGGVAWPERLRQAVSEATVVLPVIGPGWLRAQDDAGRRRLDQPEDWVRQEVVEALAVKGRVVPLMLENYQWPKTGAELDAALAPLLECQSLPVTAAHWEGDLHRIIASVVERGVPLRPKAGASLLNPDGTRAFNPGRPPKARQSGQRVLSMDELDELLETELPAWRREDNPHPWAVAGRAQELARSFVFDSFSQAVGFMAAVAPQLDAMDPPHHPRWEQQWRMVKAWFSTWDVGCRVTQLDVNAAQALEDLYAAHRASVGAKGRP